MSLRRVGAWAGKELGELRWLAALFAAASGALVTGGALLRPASAPAEVAPVSALVGVMVVLALVLGERQSLDVRSGTFRHLMTLPLAPGEIVAGKVLAFLAAATAPAVVGAAARGVVARRVGGAGSGLSATASAAGRVILLALVVWSLELAADSWPRVGLAAVLGVVAAYAGALGLAPGLWKVANLLRLVPLQGGDVRLLGAVGAALVLVGFGLTWTVAGLGCRPVE